MNKFIWIFGPSAVGKKTAMLEAANLNTTGRIRRTLGVGVDIPIIPLILPSSTVGYDQQGVEERCEQRIALLSMFYGMVDCGHPSITLIHGQRIDITGGVIDRLRKLYPKKFDLAFYIEVDEDTFYERNRLRGYDVDYDTTYTNHRKHLKYLNEIFREVKIIKLCAK